MSATLPHLLVLGQSGTAREIEEAANEMNAFETIRRVADSGEVAEEGVLTKEFLKELIGPNGGQFRFILGMTSAIYRVSWLEKMKELGVESTSVIHPGAIVSNSSRIGTGTYLAAGAVVSSRASLGSHVMINYHSVVGHDSTLSDHVVVNPLVSIGGNVSLGQRTLIGAKSFIFQGLTIGEDCQVDALTYVKKHIQSKSLVAARPTTRIVPRIDL